MEIDRTSAGRVRRTSPAELPTPSAPAAARDAADARPERLDRIELSPAARGIGGEPDAAREAHLAALRARIQAGTYRPDPEATARRIAESGDL